MTDFGHQRRQQHRGQRERQQHRRKASILLTTLLLSFANARRQMAHRRLPQHRIRSPKRQVPYPKNHPLGRHLRHVNDNEIDYLDVNDHIIGGDGWSHQQQRKRRQRQRAEPNSRLLQFLRPTSDLQIPPQNMDQYQSNRGEREKLREGGGIHRYWTVTGRNLVNEINEPVDEANLQLLVDVSSINREMNYDNETWAEAHYNTTIEQGADELYERGESVSVNGTADGKGSQTQEEITDAMTQNEDVEESISSPYKPIRLRAILTDGETSGSKYLTALQRKILMEDIINPALYAWSKALHVVPVGGEGSNGNLVVDSSQLYDGVSCGPGLDSGHPSVRVPQEHMSEGLSDTDTVIYISVTFTDAAVPTEPFARSAPYLHGGEAGPVFRGSTRKKDWDNFDPFSNLLDVENQTFVPTQTFSDAPSMTPSETEPIVESRPICPGTYLASATYCSTDQYDRPVAGILSVCISDVQSFFHNTNQIKRNIVTIMHEMGHILGFNAQSLAHFRNGDTGEPLTARDKNGDVPDVKVECTGVYPLAKSLIPLPSTKITQFKSVRGGVRVAAIVTPTVRRIARNMFGCQSLNGAELESGEWQMFAGDTDEISAGECIGDHWERRLFRTDLLNPIVDDVSYSLYISPLTLAYFADSGWYKVDTHRIAPSSIWGRNAGCNFVNQKCITKDGHVTASNNAMFCNNFIEPNAPSESTRWSSKNTREEEPGMEIHGCSLDSSSKAVCSIKEYDLELPLEYTYFGKTKLLGGDLIGGSDPTIDFCPVFQGYSNGQCVSKLAQKYVGVKKSLEVFGEANSRCVIGNVDRQRTALCLPMACVIQDRTLMVKVDGYWKRCQYAGQIISVWWNRKDYVVCPDPSHLCPTFYCPNDCFKESGTCDYRTGQCMCTPLSEMNSTSSSSWLSSYYSTPLLEPCSGSHLNGRLNGTLHTSERIDIELPEYYVENTTLLLDDPRDFDDKVSRMFAQLSSGEVVGLVASFMLCIIFSYMIWYQVVRCYKQRLLGASLKRVRSSVNSLSGLLRNASRASLNNHGSSDDSDSPPSRRRPPRPGHNPQKDKMVATLLVHNRIESAAITERQEHKARLQLAGMETSSTQTNGSEQATIAELSTNPEPPILINRSELPPLPEGSRVLAVIGAQIIEDGNDDARSSVTSATHVTSRSMAADDDMSEYTSPLYQDEDEGPQRGVQRYLRLRHGNHARSLD